MKIILYTLIAVTALLGCAACSEDEDFGQMTLRFDIVLPVNNNNLPENPGLQTRVGDPGIAEFFERPRFLYLFLCPGDPKTPQRNDVYFYSIPCSESDWKRSSDSLVFWGSFSQSVDWDPKVSISQDMELRAYMVASFNSITTEPVIGKGTYNKVSNAGFTEYTLLNLLFYATTTTPSYELSLRDVYSTPYNLMKNSSWNKMSNPTSDRTGYYGKVTDIVGNGSSGVITIQDTLYHTAAKIDFQWNAENYAQENVMESAIIRNAPSKGYLFRPSERCPSATSYSKVLLRGGNVSANDLNDSHEARYANAQTMNVGNQWSGRAYTYVIQPGNLDYTITTTEGGDNARTANRPSGNGSSNDIFASWYKLDFNIKSSPSGN